MVVDKATSDAARAEWDLSGLVGFFVSSYEGRYNLAYDRYKLHQGVEGVRRALARGSNDVVGVRVVKDLEDRVVVGDLSQ